MYHYLPLCLLAYLVWRRPVAGMIVGALEGIWLLWPLYGLPELLSFNVHLTLALTCLFAWRGDDIPHSAGLALGGAAVLCLPYYVPPEAFGAGGPAAVLMGVLCGELVVAAWVTARLADRTRLSGQAPRVPASVQRVFQTLGRLNAPLGTRDHESVSGSPEVSSAEFAPEGS